MRMKARFLGFILALVVTLSVMAVLPTAASGTTLPQTIRIGLYYKGHPGGNSPVSSVKISSSAGVRLQVGYGSSALELGPTFGSYVVCAKVAGQYHIELGDAFKSYSEAQSGQQQLADSGIDTVIAYNGNWRLWSGSYSDSAAATTAMNGMNAGSFSKRVISPSANRISCAAGGRIAFYFDMSGAGLQLAPAGSGYLTINDTQAKTYRGVIEIRRYSASDMTVVNVLPFEQYLYGVVPSEIEPYSPTEALKAQAVAARTYAYVSLNKYSEYGFDLSDTVYDQVYKGVTYDSQACTDAVDATAGKIITYGGTPVNAFFFSCANGFTEDPVNVFSSSACDYLQSVDSTFESPSSYLYTWTVSLSASGLEKQLRSKGYSIGTVTDIRINSFSRAGRVTSLTFTGSTGSKTVTLSACRTILDLYSQQYTVEIGNGDGTATLYYPVAAETAASITPSQAVSAAAEATRAFLRTITYADLQRAMAGSPTNIEGTDLVLGAAGSEGTRGHYITDYVGAATAEPNSEDSFFKTDMPYTGQVGKKTVSSILAAGEIRISGRGWGHAVGMSQEGAKALADLGYSYVEILEHYYSGATVK